MKKIINNPIFLIFWIIVILLIIFLLGRFLINHNYTSKYGMEEFTPDDLKPLLIGNFSESYVVYYNRGNIEFDNGNYDGAIQEYNLALEKNPPEKKECQIRINLAFAMLKKLNFGDRETEEKRKKLIEELEKVKKVLTEEGCAHENDNNGHSKDAQELKNDIDDFIKELKQNTQEEPNPSPSNNGNNKEEKKLEQKLKELRKASNQEREEMKELFEEHEYFFDGKTW